MKLGKIFIIVLALHVVVIGGILGYHFLKTKNKGVSSEMATQNAIETAPSSINNKAVADMDSASVTAPATTDAYATEIMTEPAPVAQSATPSTVAPVAPLAQTTAPAVTPVAPAQTAPAAQPVPVSNIPVGTQSAPAIVESTAPAVAVPAPILAAEAQILEVASTPLTYKVQKGDTLHKIAKKNSVSVSDLKSANKLTSDNLKIGQELTIPGKQAEVITEQAAVVESNPATGTVVEKAVEVKETIVTEKVVHTVKKGDTLFRISKQHHVPVNTIKTANKLTSENLKIGQKLTIPGKTKTVAKTKTAPEAKVVSPVVESGGANTYVVQKGDSIYAIAKKNNVAVKELINANNIKDVTKISIGQKLTIPAKESAASAPKAPAPAAATVTPSATVDSAPAIATVKADPVVPSATPVVPAENPQVAPAATAPDATSQLQMANSEKLD